MKLLIVEDEADIVHALQRGLKNEGYAVDVAMDGEDALDFLSLNTYDLLVLDINLPKVDGFYILKKLREKDINTRGIKGLDLGANDYLVKPFDFLELTARIRALLRREFESKPSILKEGKLSIDVSKHKVTYDDIVLNLTLKEYSLLKYLVQNKDKVISSEELINHVWDENTDPFTTVIRVHVYSLRKKLTAVSCNENMIKTIKGVGYLFGGITSE